MFFGLLSLAGVFLSACSSRPRCLEYDGSCSPLLTVLLFDRGAKYMFVTTTGANALFGGPTGIDTYCSNAKPSNLPGTGASYKALVLASTRNQSTGWVLAAGTEYRRSDDTLIGRTNAARLFVFPLTNPVQTSSVSIWTGAVVADENTWNVSTNCSDWNSNASTGLIGSSGSVTSAMIANGATSCAGPVSAYCVQQ